MAAATASVALPPQIGLGEDGQDNELLAMCLTAEGEDWDPAMEAILAEDELDWGELANDESSCLSSCSGSCSGSSSGSSLPSASEGEEDGLDEMIHATLHHPSITLAVPTVLCDPPLPTPQPHLATNPNPSVSIIRTTPTTGAGSAAAPSPSLAPQLHSLNIPLVVPSVPTPALPCGAPLAPAAVPLPPTKKAKPVDQEERRRKNREAADRSRAKKRRLLDQLPKENQALQNRVKELEELVTGLEAENAALKEHNVFLRNLVSSGSAPLRTFSAFPGAAAAVAPTTSATSAAGIILMAVACLSVFHLSGTDLPSVLGHTSPSGGLARTGRLLLGVEDEAELRGSFSRHTSSKILEFTSVTMLFLLLLLVLVLAVAHAALRSKTSPIRSMTRPSPSSLPVWDLPATPLQGGQTQDTQARNRLGKLLLHQKHSSALGDETPLPVWRSTSRTTYPSEHVAAQ